MNQSRVPNNQNRDDVECSRDGVPGEVVEDDDQLPEMLEQIYMEALLMMTLMNFLIFLKGKMRRTTDDVDVEIIRQYLVEGVNDDDLICADGDGLMGETADEEEDNLYTSVDLDS
ncbi:hypothetical protein U1Q18_025210 [Sarracenia purpurea var. burkii]